VSYLPAPYESAPRDDLTSALGAGMTFTVAGITSWILGRWSWDSGRALIDVIKVNNGTPLPKSAVVPTIGWAVAVVLMVVGAILLAFRHGRSALVLGALISVATTAIAQFSFHYGQPGFSVTQWPLYWGGAAVFVLAVLPATGRWVAPPARAVPAFPPSATYLPG
jgi:hypothetical protein